jgi:glycosyltransferase involved in cell wall biosynthesis
MMPSSMKILHVTRESPGDRRYGLGRATGPLVADLSHFVACDYFCAGDLSPHQTAAAASWAQRLGKLLPAELAPITTALSNAWACGFAAGQLAKQGGYSHLHAHDAIVAAGARRALSQSGVVWGVSQHGFYDIATSLHRHVQPLPAYFRWILQRLDRDTLSAAHWLALPTQRGCDQLARSLSLRPNHRWHVIPHARPDWQLPTREQARAALGWLPTKRYLLAVGQFIGLKRFEWIVRAMQGAPVDWQLVLLGDGDAQPYRRLAAALGMTEPLITSTDHPARYYAAADAYASASATESFGLANLEALCAGLPAVCTAVDAVPEVVGDAAWLSADREADFTAVLQRLLHADNARSELSAKALAHTTSWPRQADITRRYLAIYSSAGRREVSR